MARDGRWRRSRAAEDRSDDDTTEITPVGQLEQWRDWRHSTAEFPAVGHEVRSEDDVRYANGAHDVYGPALAETGGSGEVHEPLPGRAGRERRQPGVGLLMGGGLLALALILSGLVAAGIGPVRGLLGADHAAGQGSSNQPTTSRTATDNAGSDSGSGSGANAGSGTSGSSTTPSGAAPAAPKPGGADGRQPAAVPGTADGNAGGPPGAGPGGGPAAGAGAGPGGAAPGGAGPGPAAPGGAAGGGAAGGAAAPAPPA